jgi:hypothetical protein
MHVLLNLSGDFGFDSAGWAIECHCIIKKPNDIQK